MDLAKKIEKWKNILCYWEDIIQEYAERFDSEYKMYEKYNNTIEEMYIEEQKLKKQGK